MFTCVVVIKAPCVGLINDCVCGSCVCVPIDPIRTVFKELKYLCLCVCVRVGGGRYPIVCDSMLDDQICGLSLFLSKLFSYSVS